MPFGMANVAGYSECVAGRVKWPDESVHPSLSTRAAPVARSVTQRWATPSPFSESFTKPENDCAGSASGVETTSANAKRRATVTARCAKGCHKQWVCLSNAQVHLRANEKRRAQRATKDRPTGATHVMPPAHCTLSNCFQLGEYRVEAHLLVCGGTPRTRTAVSSGGPPPGPHGPKKPQTPFNTPQTGLT